MNPPSIARNQTGEVSFKSVDIGPVFYYTLDGSEPTTASKKYTNPVPTEGRLTVKAIAYDPATGKSSPVATEKFDICRKDWKILDIEDSKAYAILDGNTSSTWHQSREKAMPVDLVIDLGSMQNVCGFKYFPDQGMWGPGIINTYKFFVSEDGKKWKAVDGGEFSNIKNNPLWQVKKFEPVKGRYVKFRALSNTENNNETGYGEVDVITAE
jgi:alpha-L-fucosidase